MHIAHYRIHITTHLCICHGKKRISTISKRCARAQCYKRIHIWRTVHETFETADEKLLVDHHDHDGQQHLQKSHCHMISRHNGREWPVPHHMSH